MTSLEQAMNELSSQYNTLFFSLLRFKDINPA